MDGPLPQMERMDLCRPGCHFLRGRRDDTGTGPLRAQDALFVAETLFVYWHWERGGRRKDDVYRRLQILCYCVSIFYCS